MACDRECEGQEADDLRSCREGSRLDGKGDSEREGGAGGQAGRADAIGDEAGGDGHRDSLGQAERVSLGSTVAVDQYDRDEQQPAHRPLPRALDRAPRDDGDGDQEPAEGIAYLSFRTPLWGFGLPFRIRPVAVSRLKCWSLCLNSLRPLTAPIR